ncbi:MAG: methionine gamma-lyase family protein [Oscillospiraceae bacterium]
MIENFFDISEELMDLDRQSMELCQPYFNEIDQIRQFNQLKVLKAFIDNKISAQHLVGTTGYGYDDKGRDGLDRLFADIFKAEDALCRHNFMSGTHTLSVALFGILRTGDTMLCVTGRPYDTLAGVIGLDDSKCGNLAEFGIKYDQCELLLDSSPDLEAIAKKAVGAKMCYIQRSRGYATRKALGLKEIEDISKTAKKANPNIIVVVDNCYGEFTQTEEPTQHGADLIVGSLIKNPGGGIAPTGGYIAGKKELVELCGHRLSAPGTGREIGCTMDVLRDMYIGLYFAPMVTANAVKTSIYASCLYEKLGFETEPHYSMPRNDIITSIAARTPENLIAICQAIQSASPIDSFAVPQPWAMPGYDSEIIMAAGTFTMGSSIELSCDAPIREPYTTFMQGGTSFDASRAAVLLSAQKVKNIL